LCVRVRVCVCVCVGGGDASARSPAADVVQAAGKGDPRAPLLAVARAVHADELGRVHRGLARALRLRVGRDRRGVRRARNVKMVLWRL
jgi:hypothetical protein